MRHFMILSFFVMKLRSISRKFFFANLLKIKKKNIVLHKTLCHLNSNTHILYKYLLDVSLEVLTEEKKMKQRSAEKPLQLVARLLCYCPLYGSKFILILSVFRCRFFYGDFLISLSFALLFFVCVFAHMHTQINAPPDVHFVPFHKTLFTIIIYTN